MVQSRLDLFQKQSLWRSSTSVQFLPVSSCGSDLCSIQRELCLLVMLMHSLQQLNLCCIHRSRLSSIKVFKCVHLPAHTIKLQPKRVLLLPDCGVQGSCASLMYLGLISFATKCSLWRGKNLKVLKIFCQSVL